jgi:GNAT superfamily N-acetyltransferase
MNIRSAEPGDAEAVAALRRTVFPYLAMAPAQVRHFLTVKSPEERFEAYVAEAAGEVVGWAAAGLNTWTSQEGSSYLDVYVHPDHRQLGIGSALADAAHDHLRRIGAGQVRTFAAPDGVEFARRRGYDGTRQMHYSGLDPRVLPDQPPTPVDIKLVRLNELTPRQVFVADSIASLDEPSDSPLDSIDYDEWVRDTWESPALDLDLSVAAMVGDEVACFTVVETDGDRAWSGMTGTIPAHRGRGLAKLAKSVALRRAADAGVTGAFTSNDDENHPMLAVNEWLGYRRVATHTGMLREL